MRIAPRRVMALGLLALAAACASPYTPSPDRPFEPIEEFTTSAALTLENAQPETEQVAIGGSMLADYHAWTDVAIEIAGRELSKRGATVAPDDARRLKLAVTHAEFNTGWVQIWTVIRMRVETGDGYTATYEANNTSTMFAVRNRQVDGAMMRVVVAMLSDPKIVEYVTR